jgi:PAS domain S-box-containing protein
VTVTREALIHRQQVLANFGELALRSDDLQEILQEGCRLVADALGTDLAKILEIDRRDDTALVRAGVGWRDGVVGQMRLSLSEHSSESYAISEGRPIVTQDVATETRFEFPAFMNDHGVAAIVNAPIFLPGGVPFGLLQVDARQPRAFDEEDVEFLRTYCMVLGPVIDRLQTVAKLGQSDERFRLIVKHALDHAIILSDTEDCITGWFPGAAMIFGWTEEEMLGRSVACIFTPEDQASDAPRWETERARELGAAPNVRWHVAKDGRRVFLDGQTILLRDAAGQAIGFLKIAQDITERKRAEDRQSMLQAELQHRVRNVLAMIASVIDRADARGTAEELRSTLSGRIASLARTQVLLTRGADTGVELAEIIRDELLALSIGQHTIQVEGPVVMLAAKAAEVLTLAIHELTTNALKYGALSDRDGSIAVSWRVDRADDEDWLAIEWRESGVSHDVQTPGRSGFGTQLITRRVPYELHGSGEITFLPDGLQCLIRFPLKRGDSVLQTDVPLASRTDIGR